MSGPGGKSNTCPCGTSGNAPVQTTHRQPPSCGLPPPCGPPQQMNAPPPQPLAGCQMPQYPMQRPQVECNCMQNRVRNLPPPPQADIVSCSRPQREIMMEVQGPRCNCRENQPPKPSPVKPCTCVPIQPQPQPVQPCQTTHVHMPCPHSASRGPMPYQRRVAACAHCRSQTKKKKCVIQ